MNEIHTNEVNMVQAQTPSELQHTNVSDAYETTLVSNRTRYFRSAISLIPTLMISVGLAIIHWRNGTLGSNWVFPLLLLLVGCWLGYVFFNTKENKHLAYKYVPIPLRGRAIRAGIIFALTLGVSIFVWASTHYGGLMDKLPFIAPILIVGFGWCAVELLNKNTRELTEPAKAEEIRLAKANKLSEQSSLIGAGSDDDLFFNSAWYIRYPIAAALLFGLIWLADSIEKIGWFWWVIIGVLVLSVAVYVREIVLLALACGVIYLLFLGLASLPISMAIIIGLIVGATIIASAIRK